jgi:hypothetical protein
MKIFNDIACDLNWIKKIMSNSNLIENKCPCKLVQKVLKICSWQWCCKDK